MALLALLGLLSSAFYAVCAFFTLRGDVHKAERDGVTAAHYAAFWSNNEVLLVVLPFTLQTTSCHPRCVARHFCTKENWSIDTKQFRYLVKQQKEGTPIVLCAEEHTIYDEDCV